MIIVLRREGCNRHPVLGTALRFGEPSKVFAMLYGRWDRLGIVEVFMRIIGVANKKKSPKETIP